MSIAKLRPKAEDAADPVVVVLYAFLFAAIGFSVYVFFRTASQPILEMYGFRQTQTALTVFWFMKEGFKLAYETPVVGAPWAIPFEFPIYQTIVAVLADFLPFPLTDVGRGVSFIFFLATLLPVWAICRRLELDTRLLPIFGSLYVLSPQFLFWGRTFMIETTATFLSVGFLAAALPLLSTSQISKGRGLLVIAFGSAAILQKVTTGAPVALFLAGAMGLTAWRMRRTKVVEWAGTAALRTLILVIPVLIGVVWTRFTDEVKLNNPLGEFLVSSALMKWTFGSIEQRFSPEFWSDVVWERSLNQNAGGVAGFLLLVYFLVRSRDAAARRAVIGSLTLFLLPLVIFTNLHIIHYYYQTGTTIYLIFALSVAIAFLFRRNKGPIGFLFLLILSGWSVYQFEKTYSRIASWSIDSESHRTLAVANVVRTYAPSNKPILIYEQDWSSEVPFYSGRKAMTVPAWLPHYDEPLMVPERYLGTRDLGALVICPGPSQLDEARVRAFLDNYPGNREFKVKDCRVFIL